MTKLGISAMTVLVISACACVDADPTMLLTAPIFATCSVAEDDTFVCVVDPEGDRVVEVPKINLAQLSSSGQPYGAINDFSFVGGVSNRLRPSDDYAPIGERENLRIDQNIIVLDSYTVEFPSDDNLPGLSALDRKVQYITEVDTSGAKSGTIISLVDPTTITAWKDVFTSVAGGQANAIVPAKVDIQVFGTTIGGEEVESNIISVPLQVCTGCQLSSTSFGIVN